jgi:hypothetical protein
MLRALRRQIKATGGRDRQPQRAAATAGRNRLDGNCINLTFPWGAWTGVLFLRISDAA